MTSMKDLSDRIAACRADRRRSPLGRYETGRYVARLDIERRDSEDTLRDAQTLTDAIASVVAGDRSLTLSELSDLAGRDPDLVTALQHWAEELAAAAAAQAVAGVR